MKDRTKGNVEKKITATERGHLTDKLNSKTLLVLPPLKFPFHVLPSPVHHTGFSSTSSQASLPFFCATLTH